ncbi:cytochrome b562 [Thalassotalea agarivorans]|uniref:Cytochrome b562 n=1 Tax=Thalassotalea agarivorans TaxID=349064 RepID=A0A1H9Y5S8_THASX|nr:cytochrome b562 [Thalassotalea agarivorans]SES64240.1 Cytochrome b562 [Thalassotalea agarivorans]
MKKLTLLLSALLLSTSALASHPQCGKTDLAEVMDEMKDSMKAYKQAFKASDEAKMAAVVEQLLQQIDKAETLVPLQISDQATLTAEQQAQFEKYQKGMAYLEKSVLTLKDAKTADERKAALNAIGKSSKKGHKAFKMKCDD